MYAAIIKRLLIFALLLFTTLLGAQPQQELDSLTYSLKSAKQDTTKSRILVELSKKYWYSDKVKAEKYAQDALLLSQKSGARLSAALAYNSLGVINLFKGNYTEAQSYFHQSLEIQTQLQNLSNIASLHNNMAVVFDKLGNYDAALQQHELALTQRQELIDSAGISDSYNNMANVYRKQGLYPKALYFYMEALAIDETLGRDNIALGNAYNNMGIMYHLMEEYDIALNHFNEALTKFQTAQHRSGESMTFVNIGESYQKQGKLDEAFKAVQNSLMIADEIREKGRIAEAYNSIGHVLTLQGKHKQAMTSFTQALRIHSDINNAAGVVEALNALSKLSQTNKNWEKALSYAQTAKDSAIKTGYMIGLIDASLNLAQTYRATGAYKEAYKWQHEYLMLKDSMFNQRQSKQLLTLQTRYENRKKATKYDQLKLQHLNNQELLKQEQQMGTWLKIAFSCSLVIFLLLFFRQRKLQQIASSLREKNAKLRTQKEEISQQNIEFKQAQEQIKNQHRFIENRNTELEQVNHELADKNQRLTDNITYAKRVQHAVLPMRFSLKRHFADVSMIYLPKDIVSGDFYWLTALESYTYFALADGTGHGVPGAFMALLGSTFLDEIVSVKNVIEPKDILKQLHDKTIQKLHKGPQLDSDGLELALCRFENLGNSHIKMVFSGARSNVYYCLPDQSEAHQLEGVRKGIGGIFQRTNKIFVQHEVILPKGSLVYFFTDGLPDHPKPNGRRLGTRNVVRFIQRHAKLDIHTQTEIVKTILDRYKRQIKQRDDISFVILKL